jgi:hypothetical protein
LTKIGVAALFGVLVVAIPGTGAADPPMEVFLLAGQSNMVGRAEPISDGTGPIPNLFQWRDGAWEPAADPLGLDTDAAVGPGMTFGKRILELAPPGTKVGLIMCARGESSIGSWTSDGGAYRACKKTAGIAGGKIMGVVMLQGEHEAAEPKGGSVWASGFAKSLDAFEHDLGPMPFVLGQIGNLDPARSPYQQQVRDAQSAASVGHPEIALVTSTDLAVEGVHFTVDAEKTLGRRFADAWHDLSLKIPTLTDVDADSGRAGDTVTITGSGFDIANSVTFGRADAPYQIVSDSEITAVVPDAATTGAVTVSTPVGVAVDASPFGVLATIESFSPDSGRIGKAVKLSGFAFSGTTQATVNGVPAKFKVTSPQRLKLWVPPGATSGAIAVTNAAGTTVSVGTFTVVPKP